MNATIDRFGYPATLIADYPNWLVLLRPEQPTIGSLVLAARSDVEAFSSLPPDAFAELSRITRDIEATLRRLVDYAKINYLMLMMVDPHVHFHVIPRYEGERSIGGVTVRDEGWPKTPALGQAVQLSPDQIAALAELLQTQWDQADG